MPAELLVRYGVIPEIARFVCDFDPLPERGETVVVRTSRGVELGTVLEKVRGQNRVIERGTDDHEADVAQIDQHDASVDTSRTIGTLSGRINGSSAETDFSQSRAAVADFPDDETVHEHDHDHDSGDRGSSSEPHVMRVATSTDRELGMTLRTEAQEAFETWRKRMLDWKLQLELLDLEWLHDRSRLVLYVLGGRGPETTRLALLTAAAGLAAVEVQPVGLDGLVPIPATGGGCGSGGCGCSH